MADLAVSLGVWSSGLPSCSLGTVVSGLKIALTSDVTRYIVPRIHKAAPHMTMFFVVVFSNLIIERMKSKRY